MKTALIQAEAELCDSYDRFYEKVDYLTMRAVAEGSYFHVWPEDITFWLLFTKRDNHIVRFYEEDYKSIEFQDKGICSALNKFQNFVFSLIRLPMVGRILKSNRIVKIYKEVFSDIAQKRNCYISAGSIYEEHLDGIYNTAYVFDNNGKIICNQRKMKPIGVETSWGVNPGNKLETCKVGDLRIGIQICNDINYDLYSVLHKREGVDLIICPSAGYVPAYSWVINHSDYVDIIRKRRDKYGINYCRVYQCGSVNQFIKFNGLSSFATINGDFKFNPMSLKKRETIMYVEMSPCQH